MFDGVMIMPKKMLTKGVYAEVSQETYDYLSKHKNDYEAIRKAINDSIFSLRSEILCLWESLRERNFLIKKLYKKIRDLKDFKGVELTSHRYYAIPVPYILFKDERYKKLDITTKVVYGLLCELRLKNLLKTDRKKYDSVFLTEKDLVYIQSLLNLSVFQVYDCIMALEDVGLVYSELNEKTKDSIFFVYVFDKEMVEEYELTEPIKTKTDLKNKQKPFNSYVKTLDDLIDVDVIENIDKIGEFTEEQMKYLEEQRQKTKPDITKEWK